MGGENRAMETDQQIGFGQFEGEHFLRAVEKLKRGRLRFDLEEWARFRPYQFWPPAGGGLRPSRQDRIGGDLVGLFKTRQKSLRTGDSADAIVLSWSDLEI